MTGALLLIDALERYLRSLHPPEVRIAIALDNFSPQEPHDRRYIAWRSRNAHDRALRELVKRANVA